jgi:hypothetical protein
MLECFVQERHLYGRDRSVPGVTAILRTSIVSDMSPGTSKERFCLIFRLAILELQPLRYSKRSNKTPRIILKTAFVSKPTGSKARWNRRPDCARNHFETRHVLALPTADHNPLAAPSDFPHRHRPRVSALPTPPISMPTDIVGSRPRGIVSSMALPVREELRHCGNCVHIR